LQTSGPPSPATESDDDPTSQHAEDSADSQGQPSDESPDLDEDAVDALFANEFDLTELDK
jgi:hypothetical protein